MIFNMWFYFVLVYVMGITAMWCYETDLTPRLVRLSFIWPVRIIYWLGIFILGLLNELFSVFLLAFNLEYGKTRIYKFLNKIFWD